MGDKGDVLQIHSLVLATELHTLFAVSDPVMDDASNLELIALRRVGVEDNLGRACAACRVGIFQPTVRTKWYVWAS